MMIFVGFVNIQIWRRNVHFVSYVHFVFTGGHQMFDMCDFSCKFWYNVTISAVSYAIIELSPA